MLFEGHCVRLHYREAAVLHVQIWNGYVWTAPSVHINNKKFNAAFTAQSYQISENVLKFFFNYYLKYLHLMCKQIYFKYICVFMYTFNVSTIMYLTSWCMAGSVWLLTGRVNFRTSLWCCSLCDNSYWHNEEQPTSQQVVLFKEPSHCTQTRGKKTPC